MQISDKEIENAHKNIGSAKTRGFILVALARVPRE